MSIKTLRDQAHQVSGYWYNPNIHPVTEYLARLEQLENYAKDIKLDLIVNDVYGLEMFIKNVADDIPNRCEYCYEERLRMTAKTAKEKGFDAFTSTLFISPYQKHEQLIAIAEKIASEEGIKFYYVDFRPSFREGREYARDHGFYMQKYCGCVFSEAERYQKKLNQHNRG
jgi:hypothetical protein